MLISQRIAKDPTYLRPSVPYKGGQDKMFQLRLDIIRATKFIVGRELWDADVDIGKVNESIFGTEKPARADTDKRQNLYGQFCRLPFPSMLVENDTGVLYFKELRPKVWEIYPIGDDGISGVVSLLVDMSEPMHMNAKTQWECPQDVLKKVYGKNFDRYMEMNSTIINLLVVVSFEILLFMNVQNVPQKKYLPTKKENAMVPKPLLPYYSYHILDLFREKKNLPTLEAIKQEYCVLRKDTASKRAHVVRGHFKKTRTGLFWWSSFVRNSANRETHGAVDKDYRIANQPQL